LGRKNSSKKEYLVIVESPAKAKTIGKILGSSYEIESSVGHVRDLPVKGIGVNTRKNFEPKYEILAGKQKIVDKLLAQASQAKAVYLATDPDREGEAIAWHLQCILDLPSDKISRVQFNEITGTAIKQAFKNARQVNLDRVSAQQARRILDRLVGYKVSPLIQRKIGGRSAGRVQSVTVRLITEREEEIEAFEQEEYWSFEGILKQGKAKFQTQLISWQKKRIVSPIKENPKKNICIRSQEQAQQLTSELPVPQELEVTSVQERSLSKSPSPPFITSTLQRAAATVYGFGVKKTMQLAQQLYEGLDLEKSNNPIGLITYMRTDSVRISQKAQQEAREFIEAQYGTEYLPKDSKPTSKNKKNAQDAHEAVRPTTASRTPQSIRSALTSDQYKLYKLIWERFTASQMAPAKLKRVTIELVDQSKQALFKSSAQKVEFPGFMKVLSFEGAQENQNDNNDGEEELFKDKLPKLAKGDSITLHELLSKQHFTEPPPRYNEASLVKTLEELGIGRPSTYANTISTILDRKYVEKNDNKNLVPTKLGRDVNKVLIEHFAGVFETGFTAQMESRLDEIEKANLDWIQMLTEFYDPFKVTLKKAQEEIAAFSQPTDHICPTCDSHMVIKTSFYGPFLGCSQYPDCKTVLSLGKDGNPLPPPRPSGKECPKCSSEMMITYGKYGEYLLCSNEECKHKMPIIKSLGIPCPKEGCSGEIIEKKSRFGKIFYGCSSWSETKCDAVFWHRPLVNEKCPNCSSTLMYKQLKRGDKIVCSKCPYERPALDEAKAFSS